jgi:hypothetical protein
MTKTQNRFGISNFGHCDLFDICYLLFGISIPIILYYSKAARNFYQQNYPALTWPGGLSFQGQNYRRRRSEKGEKDGGKIPASA